MVTKGLLGQSAVEYLMTYGWMLLVVAIVGGAIFSVVGDQSIESTSSFSGSDVGVSNFGFNQNRALDFELQNTASEKLEIQEVNVTDNSNRTASFNQEEWRVSVGDSQVFSIPGVESSDSTNTLDVDIKYDQEGLEDLETSGTLTSDLEVLNVTQDRLEYTWFDTEDHYDAEGHPGNTEEMDGFFNEDNENVTLEGEGLWGEDDEDGINWHNGNKLPDDKPSYLKSDKYSWKVEGMIYAPESGEYTFGVDSDDGSDIYVDGQKVVEWYGSHGTDGNDDPDYNHNGVIELERGLHSFKARIEEGTGGDGLAVGWQRPSESNIETIPSKWYYIEN